MEEKTYVITKIEGEYAYLKETSCSSTDELFIAMALLPSGADIGSALLYKDMEFSLIL